MSVSFTSRYPGATGNIIKQSCLHVLTRRCLQRLNVLHNALFRLIGTHYVGPVPELLMSELGRQKIVVDMCSGTGKW